jgi:uncharacterized membrane protein
MAVTDAKAAMSLAAIKPLLGKPETHARALTKAVTWRAIGTADTYLWSWLITGHAGEAGAIAVIETVTKIGIYYVHERLWRLLKWAPDARRRSLAKAISWRVLGSLDTFLISLLVTGSGQHAATIAFAEAATKVFLYYLHERAWRRVSWGRLEAEPAPAPLVTTVDRAAP